MKFSYYFTIVILFAVSHFFIRCSKKTNETQTQTTDVKINVTDDIGNIVQGASVTFFYTGYPIGPPKITDANGNVVFTDINPMAFSSSWIAEKGCHSSRNNEFGTFFLIAHTVNVFSCVMHETGIAKIAMQGSGTYNISCSSYTGTFSAPDTFLLIPNVGPFPFHSDKAGVAGSGKDTTVQITCGDTSVIIIP